MVYECEDYDKVCTKKEYLRDHMKLKHSKKQSLKCVKCDKHFANKLSLKQHLYDVHPSKLHSCSFCGSSFKASTIKYLDFIINLCVYMEYF